MRRAVLLVRVGLDAPAEAKLGAAARPRRRRYSRLIHAEMSGACGVNHKGLCVPDIREVRKETQSVYEGNTGIAASLDLKGKNSASAFGEQCAG
mgnify:CR=1 FL=1